MGASGPTETEGGAPEGGAESGPAEPEGREAAEEGGSTEAAEGPTERVALGVVPRRGLKTRERVRYSVVRGLSLTQIQSRTQISFHQSPSQVWLQGPCEP